MTKLECALLVTPFDIVDALVQFGAEAAFCWTGSEPVNQADFFTELGRRIQHLHHEAMEKQFNPNADQRWD